LCVHVNLQEHHQEYWVQVDNEVIRLTCGWVLHAGCMEGGHSNTWEGVRGYITAWASRDNKLDVTNQQMKQPFPRRTPVLWQEGHKHGKREENFQSFPGPQWMRNDKNLYLWFNW
jgi:hypothetical protein